MCFTASCACISCSIDCISSGAVPGTSSVCPPCCKIGGWFAAEPLVRSAAGKAVVTAVEVAGKAAAAALGPAAGAAAGAAAAAAGDAVLEA